MKKGGFPTRSSAGNTSDQCIDQCWIQDQHLASSSPRVRVPIYHPPSFYFQLVLLPICALSLGLTWFLSSLGVFIRDVAHPVGVVLNGLVVHVGGLLSVIPQSRTDYSPILRLNPLVSIIDDARRTLVWGQMLDWKWWLVMTIFSLLVLQLGYAVFMKSKRAFADVM